MAVEKDLNLDPISKEPGAHPVGTGVGAAMGGAAVGAAGGALAGPVGAVVGAAAGAIAGGFGGKAAAESVNPTAEEAYWKETYHREPYYEAGRSYDDYAPAYRLGLLGRNEYNGSFEESENRLASQWETRKEGSTLAWSQASVASRAAWERIDGNVRPSSDYVGSTQTLVGDDNNLDDSDDDVVDTLNDLLESCRDGEYGFRECAEHTQSQELKTMMLRHADECRAAGQELKTQIQQMGGEAEDGGTVNGALHRGWVSVRGTLGGYSDQAMLDECERGEDATLTSYRKAVKQNLPPAIKAIVERQAQGTQRNHDQVKALRDSLKAAH